MSSELETEAGRGHSRRYYHEGRQPDAFFIVNGKSHTGIITDISENGLGIVTDWKIMAKQGDVISLMYIGRTSPEFAIQGLRIAQIRNDYTTKRIILGIFVPDEAAAERLGEIVKLLTVETQVEVTREYDIKRVPPFPGGKHYSDEAVDARLEWTRGVTGSRLDHINRSILNPETLAGNIENYIGAVQVPIGLAGPIMIKGVYTDGYIPVPIATTEGALVSSISRGARLCNHAGGVNVHVTRQRMVRAPVFFCDDMNGAVNLERWLMNNVKRIEAKANSVSSVAKLTEIIPFIFGDTVHVRFYYNTGDAAGQNMTTACTWVACEWISERIRRDKSIKFSHYNIEGNMSGDKKANYQNYIDGRGVGVVASCWVEGRILEKAMRVKPRDYIKAWQAGEVGSLQIGMIGSNINFANVIAGIFTATGQDIASVHESSSGIYKMREEGDGILFTAYLPSLVVGTVGGGTSLPTQRDCLELLGCYGPGRLFRFAEIIAATCLALDISTGAAITANEFVTAHERFGRNRPSKRLTRNAIKPDFFTEVIGEPGTEVLSFEELDIDSNSGIVTSILSKKSASLQGLFKYRLKVKKGDDVRDLPVVLKLKSADSEILNVGLGLAKLSGEDRLPGLFETHIEIFGFENSHLREIGFYRHAGEAMLKYCPAVYGTRIEKEREIFAVMMEDLAACSHLDTVNDPSQWDDASVRAVLTDLAGMHAAYLGRVESVPEPIHALVMDRESLLGARDLLLELTSYNSSRFPNIVTAGSAADIRRFLDGFDEALAAMERGPRTLTHNDFNTRNICLRPEGPGPRLAVYDWELPCIQNPQRDLIEFLVYALPAGATMDLFEGYAAFYRECLERVSGWALPAGEFKTLLVYNALILAVRRFNLYLLAHNVMQFSFMERVYHNLSGYIRENFR
jgi:NADP-dependent 3-hydroxy-3-methylglutaryl-CoA reductase